jgi:hypothetical protein
MRLPDQAFTPYEGTRWLEDGIFNLHYCTQPYHPIPNSWPPPISCKLVNRPDLRGAIALVKSRHGAR